MRKVYVNDAGALISSGTKEPIACPVMSYRDADCSTVWCMNDCAWFSVAGLRSVVYCRDDAIGEQVEPPTDNI